MKPSKRSRPARGMTLMEVLVALAVFSVVSVLAHKSLVRALQTKARLDEEQAFWSGTALAFLRLESDLAAALERGVRDTDGRERAAFESRAQGFEFTALPWDGQPPLRVAYEFRDRAIWRLTWPALDRAPGSSPERTLFLNGVEKAEMFYRGAGPEPASAWPRPSESALPRGLDLMITFSGRGAVRRAFVIHA